MKNWVVFVIVGVLGLAAGLSVTIVESLTSRDLFYPEDLAAAKPKVPPPDDASGAQKWAKAVVVGRAIHDFGSMERNSKKSHTFRIRNEGTGLMMLTPGRITCKCTVSDIVGKRFGPGEIAEIKLGWTGKAIGANPDFFQTAVVETNDPENKEIALKIKGYVTENIRALPYQVALGRVSSNETSTAEFRLFGFRSDSIELKEIFMENEELGQYFDVAFAPLPEEEVKQEKGASCGLLATLAIKPGLPLGPITQTIRIDARTDKDVQIQVPLVGRSVGDFQFTSSPKFHPSKNLLNFGALAQNEAGKAVLHLFVTGEHRNATQLSVGEMSPSGYFKVDIGPGQPLNNGKAIKYAITVELQPGLDPVNRLGMIPSEQGRVVLETTHPRTKQIPLAVRFGVD